MEHQENGVARWRDTVLSVEWPQAYGINGHPVPSGYWRQFWYPFRKAPISADASNNEGPPEDTN